MEIAEALAAVRAQQRVVLVTLRRDGRPQLSNVLAAVGADDVVRVSVTHDRAKTANLRRTPWAAVHVDHPDFWSYAVLEGDVTLSEVAAAPDDESVEELVGLYRALQGEHDDWDDYRRAMVDEGRLMLLVTPGRAYGMLSR